MTTTNRTRPFFVSLLAVLLLLFGLLAFFGSLFLWGEGFLFAFPPSVDYSFPITDLLVNAPISILAAIGLWRRKAWGYLASQFVAGFYIYASVEIFVMVIQNGPPIPIEIVLPQVLAVLVAAGLVFYLWRVRQIFG
ncbi:MAG: hypothetical protein JXB85_13175 [Anaerolineales bacterium]|nr:hypothetical protein [Anaerolineales bacterium]